MTGGHGACQYQGAGDDGDSRRHPDGEAELAEETIHGFQNIAHPDGGDVGEGGGDGSLDSRFAFGIGMNGCQMGLRRVFKHPGREHEQEVHAQRAPADIAQIGDLTGNVAPENIDGDRVADPETEGGGRIGR